VYCRRVAAISVSPQLLARMPGLIRRADVIHITGTYSFPVLPALFLSRILRKPVVWSPHGSILATHIWSNVRRKALKDAWERLIRLIRWNTILTAHVTSDREAAAVKSRIPSATVRVIPNGVDIPASIPSRIWRPSGALRLLFMGRLDATKGIENLIAALDFLGEEARLHICGQGIGSYVANLKELAQKSRAANRITFHGYVEGAAKQNAFLSADICVAPSHSENFCIVIAEALAHGVPVIASRGTPWSAVEDNRCGLWVGNDPENLARAITALAPLDLAVMGAQGRAWMQRDFGWDGIARQMYALYKEAIARG
jgi:glycosyltransferase involved in cell wall biosynthesis